MARFPSSHYPATAEPAQMDEQAEYYIYIQSQFPSCRHPPRPPEASFDEPIDFSNLRALISGGEAVPMKTASHSPTFWKRFGARRDVLRAGFGMSENWWLVRSMTPDRFPNLMTLTAQTTFLLESAAMALKCEVVDSDTGKDLPSGEMGQLQIRGPTVFTEYYGNKRATAESFTTDGWFITGDLAQLDGGGNLSLVGRGKDCININGCQVSDPRCRELRRRCEDQGSFAFLYLCLSHAAGKCRH